MSILAAIDFSDSNQLILDQALGMARAFLEPLHLIHVEPPDIAIASEGIPLYTIADIDDERRRLNEVKLKKLMESCKEKGVHCEYHLEKGPIAPEIIRKAQVLKARMIVIGSHGRSMLMDLLSGSTHEGVLHRTEIPVLVVPLIN